MKPNFPAEITNMVMVYDKQRDMVVADMHRPVKAWLNPQSVRSMKKPACG